jgi:predicted nucleic-acid-binding Zn-ribbon protein
MPYQPQPYRIVVLCGSCGYRLRVIKEGIARGVHQLSIKRILEINGGKCPKCGKRLNKRPEKIEFKTIKEASEYLDVDDDVKKRKLITIWMPVQLDEAIKELVKQGKAKSRNEFILKAIVKMLEEHKS